MTQKPGKTDFSLQALTTLAQRFISNPIQVAAEFFPHFSAVTEPEDIQRFRDVFEKGNNPAFLLSLVTQPTWELKKLEIDSYYSKPSPKLKLSLLSAPPLHQNSLLYLTRFIESKPTSDDVRFGITPHDRNLAKESLQKLQSSITQSPSRTRSGPLAVFKPGLSPRPNTGSQPILRTANSFDPTSEKKELLEMARGLYGSSEVAKVILKLRSFVENRVTLEELHIRTILIRIQAALKSNDHRLHQVKELLFSINPETTVSVWQQLTGRSWDLPAPVKK